MNISKQAKDEEFIKEQFVKGRILDDTKDYGRTQFVDEIYKLEQENQQLKIQISAREEECRKLKKENKALRERKNIALNYMKNYLAISLNYQKEAVSNEFKIVIDMLNRGVSDE